MITISGDFRPFPAKKIGIFFKINILITISALIAVVFSITKRQFFAENIFKMIILYPRNRFIYLVSFVSVALAQWSLMNRRSGFESRHDVRLLGKT
jgi:hypothetical protein